MIAAVNILLLCYHLSFRCTAKSQGEKTPALSLYDVSPVPLGQFTSVTYPRRTGGKRLDKNRMPIRAFEIQDVVHVVNSWIFFNPCGYLRDLLLPTGFKKSSECCSRIVL